MTWLKDSNTKLNGSATSEAVASSELVQAAYDGYRSYHTYTKLDDCPYTGSLKKAWLYGQSKAEKEDG